MSTILNTKLPQFSDRIRKEFCPDCKHKRKCNNEGVLFESQNGICKLFEWISEKRKQEYEEGVREAQAITAQIKKGKTLEEIFANSIKEEKKLVIVDTVATKENKHYFYCNKRGKQVIYTRNTLSKSYQSEVIAFRKYLVKQGIVIEKEEVK